MKKIFIYILLSFHVFFAGNIGVFIDHYFSNVLAASNTWDFSNASEYTLSHDTLSSIQNGQVDLDLQLIQLDAIGDNGVNPLLDGARRLSVSGDYTYVSTYRQDAIQVLDHSDPSDITAGVNLVHNSGSIMLDGAIDSVIKGNHLYVAEYLGDSIQIFDISDPANPVAAGNLPNSTTVRLNGPRGLAIGGDYLYVASFVDDAIQVFDISNPTTLVDVGELDTVNGRLNGARDIIVEGDYAYVSARNGDSIQIIDISDPTTPVFASATSEVVHDGTTVFLDGVWGIDKQGDYVYATGYNDDRIQIIDVSDPTLPVAVTNLSTTELPGLNGPRDLVADGDFLFIADYLGDSIMVVDISDPTNPLRESELINGTTTNLNGPIALERDGDLLHIATFPDDDYIILESGYSDISPSVTPTNSFNYGTENLATFTEILGSGNQGTTSYQISRDGGSNWYYHDGSTWQLTTSGADESSSAALINSNLSDFNSIGSGNDFLWRGYLNSNGDEKVEINSITLTSVAPTPILSVTKTDDDIDNIVQTNQLVRYTVEVANNGVDASGVIITDPIDSNFGDPFDFVYDSCGSPSSTFNAPILTISSVSINSLETCSISYSLQVDVDASDGITISNTADSSAAIEGGNDPIPATSDTLSVLACNINDTNIIFETDNFGEDTYWSLTPSGNACGIGEVANGGNPNLDCSSGGAPNTAGGGDPYADSTNITEGVFNLTVGQQYDLHVIDDFGDGITVGGNAADPDIRIQQNGIETNTFSVLDAGGVFTFTAVAQSSCEDITSPNININQASFQNDPAIVDSATFSVIFDEAINTATFTSTDITISGTTGAITSGPTQVPPNDGTAFEFSVTGMTIGDIVVATVPAGGIEDLAGNTNNASTSTDNQVTFSGISTLPFITTWKTDNTGVSSDTQISIPTIGAGYDYDIDCNSDGIFEAVGVTGDYTCDYTVAGTYTVEIYGDFPRIFFNNTGDKLKILSIDQWGDIEWTNMLSAFYGATNLDMDAVDIPDLSNASSMQNMFLNVEGAFSGDITSWDVSTISVMTNLFANTTQFNQNISSWDTSNVENMRGMFSGTDIFNQPLITTPGGWNTGNVETMENMFRNTLAFDQDITSWDTSGVGEMQSMFQNASMFNTPLPTTPGGWDTGEVKNMANMFANAAVFNQNIGSWNTSNVSNMQAMFQNADAFDQALPTTPGGWNTSNVLDFDNMFLSTNIFNQDISSWDTSSAVSMDRMFENAFAFNQSLANWDISGVTIMGEMLNNTALSIANYDATLISWNTQSVQSNITLGALNLNYCLAETARANLIASNNWDIIGDSIDCPPVVTGTSFASGALLPGGNHDITINYSDTDNGVDASTANISLHRWDGVSSYGPDISGTGVTSGTINTTIANYSTNNLEFGRYQYVFEISDNSGNTTTETIDFYIDEPEFIISTPEIDMGILNSSGNSFSQTVQITVKTVGAAFDVNMNADSNISFSAGNISSFDGTTGYGYQATPFSGSITAIGVDETIATHIGGININGEKNEFIFEIQLGAIIDMQQAAGEYLGNIDFDISLTY